MSGVFAAFWHWLNAMLAQKPFVAEPRATPVSLSPLTGILRYLIAVEDQIAGRDGEIIEVGYDGPRPRRGRAVRYCNLYDQVGKYGPYLKGTDTADKYDERVVDPNGTGWPALLADQCHSALAAGFTEIEWDNPDGYDKAPVMEAIAYAASRGLKIWAKNPTSCGWYPTDYVKHPAVVGIIVERGAGNPSDMDELRKAAGKPHLPVYFVGFRSAREDGRAWVANTASAIRSGGYRAMGVTLSPDGEYTSSADVLVPR